MCAVRKELLVDFSDLRYFEVECGCGTRISIDLESRTALLPSACPGCNQDLQLKNSLISLAEQYQYLKNLKQAAVRIRVPLAGGSL